MKNISKLQLSKTQLSNSLTKYSKKNFGVLADYNKRKNQKVIGGALFTPEQKFWVTSARPSNFGDHLDVRTKLDNWFDENRVYNEENKDYEVRRAQLYIYHGFNMAMYVLAAKYMTFVTYQFFIGRKRYVRDTYKEIDIGILPPGEIIQTIWNGEPIFVRRLTRSEVAGEAALPTSTMLDPGNDSDLSMSGASSILVCSASCTHLGCIPVPYIGAYKGWVCLCHGSVYDKSGRVRQGPALKNLPYINNSVFGDTLCIEERQFPNEPSKAFLV
jgi:ubiquinol-cytochrome c reductase iron-sulfur subunit